MRRRDTTGYWKNTKKDTKKQYTDKKKNIRTRKKKSGKRKLQCHTLTDKLKRRRTTGGCEKDT